MARVPGSETTLDVLVNCKTSIRAIHVPAVPHSLARKEWAMETVAELFPKAVDGRDNLRGDSFDGHDAVDQISGA